MQDIPLITWDADPLTNAELAKVEAAIGRLPDDYRQFLLSKNGGRTRHGRFEFPNSDCPEDGYLVTSFHDIDPQFPPTVLTTRIRWKLCRFIQIAACHDTPFLMLINGPGAGTVFFWYWQLEKLWDAQDVGKKYLPKAASLRKLAPSFTDFVNGLVRFNDEQLPKLTELERSVENFAKYGDQWYSEATAFFDKMSIDELNQLWPKDGDFALSTLAYAARWSQIRICRYLLDRGAEIHGESTFTSCCSNFEIAKMFIESGATDVQLQGLLHAAACGMAWTRPEEHHKVILHLIELGIQPDFNDPEVVKAWTKGPSLHSKKMLSFLLSVISFPDSIAEQIRQKLSKPPYDRFAQ